MDWKALSDAMQLADGDYPDRRAKIVALGRVLDGTQYDHLGSPFSEERSASGEYIPLDQRRPSVRNGWCKTVVDDSASMLFGQGRWPAPAAPSVDGEESPTVTALVAMVEQTKLAATMMEAATKGSVGSVAILFRVLRNRPFFNVMDTAYLTPVYDPMAPDTLSAVIEKRKVTRKSLIETGYDLPPGGGPADLYWFQRIWDANEETWFLPWPVAGNSARYTPLRDDARSAIHALGLVPIVWIKNLPAGDTVDGACSFAGGIDTEIEADYQLSQGGRGLKYSSDPTLLIKEPFGPDGMPARVGGAASALLVSAEGDARLLEISGGAVAAVIDYVDCLHKCAIAVMHGDGSDRDKMSSAQSGRAMELLKQPLVWLASKLRISYGDGALLDLLKMVCVASGRITGGVICGDKAEIGLDPKGLTLVWPPFFHPTYDDKAAEASAITTLVNGGVMSRRTAVQTIGESYDLADVDAELAEIAADEVAQTALLAAREAQTQAKGVADA